MELKVSKDQSQTLQEYLEYDYPELLEQLKCANKGLINLQVKAIEYATICKVALSAEVGKIDANVEKNIMNYLYALSLFAFASRVWSFIDEALKKMDDALQKNNYVEERTEDLQALLEKVCNVPFDKLVDFNNCSMFCLESVMDSFPHRIDPWVCKAYNANATWSFRDITGTLKNSGLTNDLITCACNAPSPTKVTIPTF
jgi:hypothetical protein